jgi:probable HAF family extracellular repeat protein
MLTRLVFFVVVLLSLTPLAAVTTYNVIDLGPAPSTGDSGKDINSFGTVAFTVSTAVYLYQNGAASPVNGLFANNGPLAINDMGHLAGANNLRSYIYRNGAPTDLGVLEPSGEDYTFASDLNNSDVVVGTSYVSSQLRYRAFIWQNGSMSQLPAPGGVYAAGAESTANGINNNGVIAGSYNNQNPGGVAVEWSGGVATPMLTLAGFSRSEASDINLSNQAVGYSADANFFNEQAVIWNGLLPTSLGSLPGRSYTFASGINNLGAVVGSALTSSGDSGGDAFVWFNGSMTDLNSEIPGSPQWHLTSASAINDSGQIVGAGVMSGQAHSFLLVPTPEPVALGALALLASLIARQRKH